MSTDFSQKERAFVAELEATTGRDLEGWMAAIGQAQLSHRNEIIDWLRQQGFPFSRASWIERIHHNGGQLIYGPADPRPHSEPRKRAAKPAPESTSPPVKPVPVRPVDARQDGDIDHLLAAAKAYRPLAQVLLREILRAVPGADAQAMGSLIVVSFDRTFAAIWPGPKDVRLMLALGGRTVGSSWVRVKRPETLDGLSSLTHMIVLTDARQLTGELMELVGSVARGQPP